MDVRGGALDMAALFALALLLNLATTLYGTGIALRLQSRQAGLLVLIPVFMLIFLTPVFTPREDLSGWLKTAAGLNPITPPMEAGRGFLAGDPVSVGAGLRVRRRARGALHRLRQPRHAQAERG